MNAPTHGQSKPINGPKMQMQQISLIHPIYLDVPMLVSFAAALQGGLSFGSEVTHEKAIAQSEVSKVAAKLGFSELFSSLFQASVDAESTDSDNTSDTEVTKESKAHTEASIAIVLYDRLRRSSGYLAQPKSLEDFAALEPGALVELQGTMLKNPIDAVVDYIDAVNILSRLGPSEASNSQSKQQVKKADRAVLKESPLLRMRAALEEDRRRTPISNVQLKCSQPAEMTAVVTLRTQNLRDLTLSELHKNSVRVVGKVTRAVTAGQSMSAFENYGMAMVPAELLTKLFNDLAATSDVVVEFSDVAIQGPAVQLLPLMVFV